MTGQSYDGQMTEWQRLAGMGWLFMTVGDIKAMQEALQQLLVRDEQWEKKWMAALDLVDGPVKELIEVKALLKRAAPFVDRAGHEYTCKTTHHDEAYNRVHGIFCDCLFDKLANDIDAALGVFDGPA